MQESAEKHGKTLGGDCILPRNLHKPDDQHSAWTARVDQPAVDPDLYDQWLALLNSYSDMQQSVTWQRAKEPAA